MWLWSGFLTNNNSKPTLSCWLGHGNIVQIYCTAVQQSRKNLGALGACSRNISKFQEQLCQNVARSAALKNRSTRAYRNNQTYQEVQSTLLLHGIVLSLTFNKAYNCPFSILAHRRKYLGTPKLCSRNIRPLFSAMLYNWLCLDQLIICNPLVQSLNTCTVILF